MLALRRYETNVPSFQDVIAVPIPTSVTLDLPSFFVASSLSEVEDFGPKGPMQNISQCAHNIGGAGNDNAAAAVATQSRHIMCRYASITTTNVSSTAWRAAPQSHHLMMGLPEEQVQWREAWWLGWREARRALLTFQSFYLFAKRSIFFGNLLDQFSIETDRLSKFFKR